MQNIEYLLEYIFCLMYVSGLFICILPYLYRQYNKLYTIAFLLIYGLLDFMITGSYVIQIDQLIIINLLVVVSDYLMVCLYERKILKSLLFYTTMYFSLYLITVNFVTALYTQLGFDFFSTYQPTLERTVLVISINSITILIFNILKKYKIIPVQNILNEYYLVFNIINLVVLSVYLIFFSLHIIDIYNSFILIIFVTFIILWLVLLYVIHNLIGTHIENNTLLMLNLSYQNADSIIEQYRRENEEIRKIKHDMKNHLQIIRSFNNFEKVHNYIEGILEDIQFVQNKTIYTGNGVIDTVLSLKKLQYPNIKFVYEIDVTEIKIADRDISSILFNLIDNACQNTIPNGCVQIKIVQQFEKLIIMIVNNIDKSCGIDHSFKKGHGYGLKIVKSITHKYNGSFCIEQIQNNVIAQVFIDNDMTLSDKKINV